MVRESSPTIKFVVLKTLDTQKNKVTYFYLLILRTITQAGVAKWLRQWVVTPSFAGSSPVIRLC